MTRPYDYTPERDVKALYEKQGGLCFTSVCRKPIHLEKPRDFIIEHDNQLSISKDNSLKNKSLRCKECAHKKTNGTKATSYGSDAHARAKLRHIRGELKPKLKREIPSRPMQSRKSKWPKRSLRRHDT